MLVLLATFFVGWSRLRWWLVLTLLLAIIAASTALALLAYRVDPILADVRPGADDVAAIAISRAIITAGIFSVAWFARWLRDRRRS